jgi:hypothetical protein
MSWVVYVCVLFAVVFFFVRDVLQELGTTICKGTPMFRVRKDRKYVLEGGVTILASATCWV